MVLQNYGNELSEKSYEIHNAKKQIWVVIPFTSMMLRCVHKKIIQGSKNQVKIISSENQIAEWIAQEILRVLLQQFPNKNVLCTKGVRCVIVCCTVLYIQD
jgi:hypothetical protein